MENDILRVASWGANQNFIDSKRLALVYFEVRDDLLQFLDQSLAPQ